MDKQKAISLLRRIQDPEPYEPKITEDAYYALEMGINALEEQRTGEWILCQSEYGDSWVCSECGEEYVLTDGTIEEQHYCPNCGSYNGGEG